MSSEGSESESDVEMKSKLPKNVTKRAPKSPSQEVLKNEPKKLTTKDMIHQALIDLKSRKGVSLHAIKKYMVEKYNVDTDKINYYIKKNIKIGVEKGTILQTKGIGASGSFKLAPIKPEKKKTKKPKAEKPKKMEKTDKPKMKKTDSTEKTMEKKMTKKKAETKPKVQKKEKTTKKDEKEPKLKKAAKEIKVKAVKEPKNLKAAKVSKMAKETMTPAKKRTVMMKKRKSIGSIIKPPKMKPKAKG